MIIAKKIKELRLERNITQPQLANEVGVAKSMISQWESEKNEPKATYIVKLANFFQVATDYLLGNSNDIGVIVNNNLSETENYLVQKLRLMNSEKKQELVSYANYLANKDNYKITNSQNIVDISDLSDIERAEVVGFINGFRKELFSHKYSKANTQSNNQNFTNNKNLNNIG